MATSFAVLIPLGPGNVEHRRTLDLLDSLFFYEESISHLVIVEDGGCNPSRFIQDKIPRGCCVSVLPHPRPNSGLNASGGLCTAELVALKHIHKNSDVDFVVKLDTDSLIIAPFSEKLAAAFESHPLAGTIGVLGNSCNRSTRSFKADRLIAQLMEQALPLGLSSQALPPDHILMLEKWGIKTWEQQQAFRRICSLLAPLLHSNFSGAHCQGGAYALSARLISQLAATNVFSSASAWVDLEFGEDQMMGALCALTGLEALDLSERGQPFGVQAIGLPYAPEVLLSYNYSIIHSVKNDATYSEAYIREFFRQLRVRSDYSLLCGPFSGAS